MVSRLFLFTMKRYFSKAVLVISALLVSCDQAEPRGETEPEVEVSLRSNRSGDSTSIRRHEASNSRLTDKISERRRSFAEKIFKDPPEQHYQLTDAIIEELQSGGTTDLLRVYLENSTLLEPSMTLQTYLRVLEEPNLGPLLKEGLRSRIRDELGISPDENPLDLKELKARVKNHLDQDPNLIGEGR